MKVSDKNSPVMKRLAVRHQIRKEWFDELGFMPELKDYYIKDLRLIRKILEKVKSRQVLYTKIDKLYGKFMERLEKDYINEFTS